MRDTKPRFEFAWNCATYLLGWILFSSAVFKLVSLLSSAKLVSMHDAVLGVSNRTVYATVGAVELLASLTVLGTNLRPWWKQVVLGCMGTGMAVYRLIRWERAVGAPCACLGVFGQGLPFPPEWLDMVLIGLVASWIGIGLRGVVAAWQARSETTPSASVAVTGRI